MKTIYTAAPASHLTDSQAKLLGRMFDRLRQKHGKLTAKIIVDEALADEKSPLRAYLTLNLAEAARKRWLDEARSLLRGVQVTIVGDTGPRQPVRAYVSVVTSNGRSYEPMMSVLSSDELRQQMLNQALVELRQFEARYRTLAELAEVFDAIIDVSKTARRRKAG